jgi:hypothetical protein
MLHGFQFLINPHIRHESIIYKLNHWSAESVSATGMHNFTFLPTLHKGYNLRENIAAVLIFQSEICYFLEARAGKLLVTTTGWMLRVFHSVSLRMSLVAYKKKCSIWIWNCIRNWPLISSGALDWRLREVPQQILSIVLASATASVV